MTPAKGGSGKHEHAFTKRIAIPVFPTTTMGRVDADNFRARLPQIQGKFAGAYNRFFDHFQKQRYILARQCECKSYQAYDLVNKLPEKEAK